MAEPPMFQCRLCLNNSEYCYSLFDEHVAELIESFTSIKIYDDDNLPTNCCSQCLEDVYTVHKIRSRIIQSDQTLRERLTNNTVPINIKTELEEHLDQKIEPDSTGKEEINLQIEIAVEPEQTEETNEKMNTDENYECEDCNLKFRFQKFYLQHMRTHNNVTACPICRRQVLACNYKRHLEVHKSAPKVCELCGVVAKNAESLRGHVFYMHKSTAEKYKCPDCGKFFRYKYKFQLHKRKAHGGEKTHICEFCGKDFYTARDVKRHVQMTHLKLRPYVCQYCNKGFSSSYARRTHVRQHTNEKPFRCEVCAEGFRQRVSLKTHLKSKHGIDVRAEESNLKQETVVLQQSALL